MSSVVAKALWVLYTVREAMQRRDRIVTSDMSRVNRTDVRRSLSVPSVSSEECPDNPVKCVGPLIGTNRVRIGRSRTRCRVNDRARKRPPTGLTCSIDKMGSVADLYVGVKLSGVRQNDIGRMSIDIKKISANF